MTGSAPCAVPASRISKSPPTDGPPVPSEDSVLAAARAAGFPAAGIVDPRLLGPWAGRLRELRASGFLDQESLAGLEWDWVLQPADWASRATVLVCCLSCAPSGPDDLSTPGDPHALIAPFARAHHYRMAVRMLGMLPGGSKRISAWSAERCVFFPTRVFLKSLSSLPPASRHTAATALPLRPASALFS